MPDARIHIEPVMVPGCTYPMPPYHFIGQGIAIVYEIPFHLQSALIIGILSKHQKRPARANNVLNSNSIYCVQAFL